MGGIGVSLSSYQVGSGCADPAFGREHLSGHSFSVPLTDLFDWLFGIVTPLSQLKWVGTLWHQVLDPSQPTSTSSCCMRATSSSTAASSGSTACCRRSAAAARKEAVPVLPPSAPLSGLVGV